MVIQKEELKLLLELQETQMSIEKLEKALLRIEKEKENYLYELSKIEEEEALELLEINKIDEEIANAKEEISFCEENIKRTEKRLNLVKKAEEYKALLREKARFEDRIIKLRERLKELQRLKKERQEAYERKKKELERKQKEIKEELKDLDLEKERLIKRLEEVKLKERELLNTLPHSVISKYEELKTKIEPPVIVPIVSFGACGGCGMKLPAYLYSKAVRGEIIFCPNCGRILYYEV